MAQVICDMSMSLDGYVTGPNDSRDNPFGDGAGKMDTEVVFGLEREGTGTRLLIDQSGFDPREPKQQVARRAMDDGWRTRLIDRLVACLDTMT